MSDFKAKMHQIPFRLGSAPDPAGGGSLQRSPGPLFGCKGPLCGREGKGKDREREGVKDGEVGKEEVREGREREGMEEGRGKMIEGMGGTGQDMGWDGEGRVRERRKGRERQERGYSPQTSIIPGVATGQQIEDRMQCSDIWVNSNAKENL